MLTEPWRITLFGGLQAAQAGRAIHRFQTAKTAELLAYLACFSRRAHARDELTEILWPESDPLDTRNRLRVALSSLRRQLEPPGIPAGSVLEADRATIRLNPAAFQTDVQDFEAGLKAAARAEEFACAEPHLTGAVSLYSGELLQGCDAVWLLGARETFAHAVRSALRRLAEGYLQAENYTDALACALRLREVDPWEEQGTLFAMRCCMAQNHHAEALRYYQEWEQRIQEAFHDTPSEAVRDLAAQLQPAPSAVTLHEVKSRPLLPPPQMQATQPQPPVTPARPDAVPTAQRKLPLPLTPFFGRETELAQIVDWLQSGSSRLATLTGPGGIGKTRCLLEAARQIREIFSGNIVFVPLEAVAIPDLLGDAILTALGAKPDPRGSPCEAIEQAVSGTPTLLLLDNFEQLVEGGAEWITALLASTTGLTCLLSSRQALGVAGEQEFPLLPLPVPGEAMLPERLAECAGVQIFVSRAQAIRADFQITPRNAAVLAQLCNGLEGIPLAIELAASWTRILTPAQMLERLEQRFDLLVQRRREGNLRHQTLRATLAWSYQSLSPQLQRIFRLCAVFRGGWTLEAAIHVCAEPRAAEFLEQLRERSLVLSAEQTIGDGPSAMRCRLLDTLREFAQEQGTTEEMLETRSRHAGYYLRLAEQAEPHLLDATQAQWLARLEAEQGNLRCALDFLCHAEGKPEEGLRLAGALWRFWFTRGFLNEGRQRLAQVLQVSQSAVYEQEFCAAYPSAAANTFDLHRFASAYAKALGGASALALAQGDYPQAQAWSEEQLEVARRVEAEGSEAEALHRLGNVALAQGNYHQARTLYENCISIRRCLQDRLGMGQTLNNLGIVAYEQGDFCAARALYEEFLAICRETGDRKGMGGALSQLGILARAQKEFAAAREYLSESLVIRRELGDKQGTAFALANLANVFFDEGNLEMSGSIARESLVLLRELGDQGHIAVALRDMASQVLMEGHPKLAARLYGAEAVLRESLGASIAPRKRAPYEANLATLRRTLGEGLFRAAWTLGRSLTLDQALDLALQKAPSP